MPTYTASEVQRIRQLCKTDLYWFGKDICKKDFVESTHRPMCDFYAKKDSSFKTFKEFALQYQESRDRIQLVPRLTYKSTIKVLDNVQWIINWPEIRILTVTSNDSLSSAFIDELTSYFVIRGNAERNPESGRLEGGMPTTFQTLFPEHCISEKESVAGEFITPARKNIDQSLVFKEPTAGCLGVDSRSSGWRCDILDYDDIVSDASATIGQLDKLTDRMAIIYELMVNHGFRHTIATRYHPLDPYGRLAESHGITELYGDYDREGLKYMCRPCWWLKGKPYEQPDYTTWEPNVEDVDLYFSGSDFKSLKKKMKNPEMFFSQQLNSPHAALTAGFTEEMVRANIVDHTAIPRGETYIFWDTAFVAKNARDFTVGAVMLLDEQKRWWLIELIRGRYRYDERCYQIVKAIRDFSPRRTGIEDVLGIQDSMRETLSRHAVEMNVALNIDWITVGRGVEDAKLLRMTALEPLFNQKRLLIVNTINCMDDLVNEFKSVGSRRAHNDIPDAISRCVETYSHHAVVTSAPTPEEDKRQWHEMAEREFHDLMFRRGKYAEGSAWDLGTNNADYRPPADEPEEIIDSMTGLPSTFAF